MFVNATTTVLSNLFALRASFIILRLPAGRMHFPREKQLSQLNGVKTSSFKPVEYRAYVKTQKQCKTCKLTKA